MYTYSLHEVTVKSQALAVTPELVFDLCDTFTELDVVITNNYRCGHIHVEFDENGNFVDVDTVDAGMEDIYAVTNAWRIMYKLIRTIHYDYKSRFVGFVERKEKKDV